MTGESKETEPQEGINISQPVLGHISACDVLTSTTFLYISCFTPSTVIPSPLNIFHVLHSRLWSQPSWIYNWLRIRHKSPYQVISSGILLAFSISSDLFTSRHFCRFSLCFSSSLFWAVHWRFSSSFCWNGQTKATGISNNSIWKLRVTENYMSLKITRHWKLLV